MLSYRLYGGQISGKKNETALRTFKLYMTQPYVNKLSATVYFIRCAINTTLKGFKNMTKRIMVDISLTLLHHGHIRLLQKASELGDVVVALTRDDNILKTKGYIPELSYDEHAETLMAIKVC